MAIKKASKINVTVWSCMQRLRFTTITTSTLFVVIILHSVNVISSIRNYLKSSEELQVINQAMKITSLSLESYSRHSVDALEWAVGKLAESKVRRRGSCTSVCSLAISMWAGLEHG